MKVIRQLSNVIAMLILMASFSQCSSAQKLQKKAPVEFGSVYYQNWNSGIKEGGSGLTIFIPVNEISIILDSVYFKGKATKLKLQSKTLLYVGQFKSGNTQFEDLILSSDAIEEYANKIPKKEDIIPFDIKDNECVVSYIKDDKTLYYKISNVQQREPLNYPSSPPDKN